MTATKRTAAARKFRVTRVEVANLRTELARQPKAFIANAYTAIHTKR